MKNRWVILFFLGGLTLFGCGSITQTLGTPTKSTGDFVATALAETAVAETSVAELVALTIAAIPTNTPTATYTPMPLPTSTSTRTPSKTPPPYIPPTAKSCSGETVQIMIKNDTGGQVTLYLTGPCSYTFYLSTGNSSIYVLPGAYSYTAYGCGGATLSGSKSLNIGDEWTWFCE